MSDFLPFSRPSMGDAELAALREVLQSGWITTGPKNQALEEAFCALTGNRHAIAVSSATGGMHVTLMALGISAGDEVITPSQTWVSTLNMICLLGATPVMIDVDPDNLMITPKRLKRRSLHGPRRSSRCTMRARRWISTPFARLPSVTVFR